MLIYRIYLNSLNFLIKFLIKTKLIPLNPIKELRINTNKPILYILPYSSRTNLIILQQQCKNIGLPDPFIKNNINGTKLPAYIFITNKKHLFKRFLPNTWLNSKNVFNDYFILHKKYINLNIQILPVFIIINRSPETKKKYNYITSFKIFNIIKKIFIFIWLGRDSFIMFSPILHLNNIIKNYNLDNNFINKLIRVAKIYYLRKKLAMTGPKKFSKNKLFYKLLTSEVVKKVIIDESRNKNISIKKAEQNAIYIIKEINANFSYETIRLTDRLLGLIFKYLYKKININNINRIHKLIKNGHKIVYAPVHRSHMDYLLLSYILYHQGLAPPHIAAGINLNFWPVGQILRKLGAFFIRRTFKNNKLYSTIFREYLNELFKRGYSIEYFIEGGRSRTGCLLKPKTGTLSITLQTIIRNSLYQITVVPIYIGYDNIIETKSYEKELYGAKKTKENIFQLIHGFCKLKNLGQSYINFSKPIPLLKYLNDNVLNWDKYINTIEYSKPSWLNQIVNYIATDIMVNINNASVVNAMNLFSTALFSSLQEKELTSKLLIEQIECYLKILNNIKYTTDIIIPNKTAEEIFNQILKNNNLKTKNNFLDKKLIINYKNNIILITYYKNNIYHLLVIPSLIACIIFRYKSISRKNIYYQIKQIYPFLKSELFLHYNNETINNAIDNFINTLNNQKIIYLKNKNQILINLNRIKLLQLLSIGINETLQRYTIILFLLNKNPEINKNALEKKSYNIIKYISTIQNNKTINFFDKSIFLKFIETLGEKKHLSDEKRNIFLTKKYKLYNILSNLISSKIRLIIETFNEDNKI